MNRFSQLNWNPDAAELRRFARVLAAGMPSSALLWFLLVRYGSGEWRWAVPVWIIGIGVPVALLLPRVPRLAIPVYRVWFGLVAIIDTVVSNTLLTFAYFALVAPVGLVMRLSGRRSLEKGFRRGSTTYWRPAEKIEDPRRYFRQF